MGKAGNVPICSPHAAVAGEGANAVGIIRAVDADAGLAEADPTDADGVIRAAWEHVKLAGSDATVEHAFVPAECGHGSNAEDAPFPPGRRMGAGSWRNGHAGDERVAFVEVQDGFFQRDDEAAIRKFGFLGEVPGWRHVFDFEWSNVWDANFVASFQAVELEAGIELHEELDGAMVTLAEELAVAGVGEVFDLGLRGGLGLEIADVFELGFVEFVEGVNGIDAVERHVFIDDAGLRECTGALPALQGVGDEATGTAIDATGAEHLLIQENLELRGEFALVDEDGAGHFRLSGGREACDGGLLGCVGRFLCGHDGCFLCDGGGAKKYGGKYEMSHWRTDESG